ncbi:hypothetical protein BY458DRAFT_518950 [Sporodiniella umbellata]|nr:hypothetical protein BY458DRAFT_518950 [Sporodiniella umbellata]
MPMVKNLENVHQQLMEVARESNTMSYRKYTAGEVERLQDKLRLIDSQYSQGAFDMGLYEQEGLAQVSHELEKVHRTLHCLLARLD